MSLVLFIRSLLFLAFVLLLMYSCFVFAQRKLKQAARHPQGQLITIIESKKIDQKLSVNVVAIGGEYFVLAFGQNSVAIKKLERESTEQFHQHAE